MLIKQQKATTNQHTVIVSNSYCKKAEVDAVKVEMTRRIYEIRCVQVEDSRLNDN